MKRLHLISCAGFLLLPFSSFAENSQTAKAVVVGSKAPAPTASDETGKAVNLADHYKQGTTLLFFYPKANTGG